MARGAAKHIKSLHSPCSIAVYLSLKQRSFPHKKLKPKQKHSDSPRINELIKNSPESPST